MRCSRALLAVAGSVLTLAAAGRQAEATWSILLVDTRTGEIALGSATCLTGFNLRDNTPVLIPNVGGCTAQSFVDSTGQNRSLIRDEIALRTDPALILQKLSTFDTGHQTRQYGFVDAFGRTATFSGTGAGAWAGGKTGQIGDIAYAIQGNVLSGPCVVDAAVEAAINTPGDLAAKLMASMEAARVTGGDGRCSCSQANPIGCGCPPATFTKASHIAYMLIARTGDRYGGNGLHRVGTTPRSIATADLNLDGLLDVVTANAGGSNISALLNRSPVESPFPIFSSLPVNTPTSTNTRAVACDDLTGDGLPDAAVTRAAPNALVIFRGNGDGSFTQIANLPSGGVEPNALAIADFDGNKGPDVAVMHASSGNVVVRLNQGSGAFGEPLAQALAITTLTSITAADVNGDAKPDLAIVGQSSPKLVTLINTGSGTFTTGPEIQLPPGPVDLAAGDLDADGDMDFATVRAADKSVGIHLQAGGSFTSVNFPLTFTPASVSTGDVTNDGLTDVVAAGVNGIAVFVNKGSGVFQPGQTATSLPGHLDSVLRDFDGDGDLDLATTLGGTNLMTVHNEDGVLNSGLGFATGDYFMNFNVANQTNPDPDPVLQLQELYDDWREDLLGRADAVQSSAIIDNPVVPAKAGQEIVLVIQLKDWQGDHISIIPPEVIVEIEEGSAGVCTIETVFEMGPGEYHATLKTTGAVGIDRFRITAEDNLRHVILMPSPTLTAFGCEPDCDGNGSLNIDDFVCFQSNYAVGSPLADCDGSGKLDIDDFVCFMSGYALGC